MRKVIVALGVLAAAPLLLAAGKTTQPTTAVERGKAVYQYNCATCHGAGVQMPGTDSLAIKYKGTKIPPVIEDRRDLTAAQIEYFTRHGVDMMPNFRPTEISDQDLKDMIAYLTKGKK